MSLYLESGIFDEKYTTHEILNKNKNCKVYVQNNKYAIKVAPSDWALTDVCYLTQLKHPNIIKLLNYTFQEDAKTNNIIIKYAMPLGQSIKTVYQYPQELFTLIYDVTSALKYMKDMGYIYADLKPENIVRMPETKTRRSHYVLIDMGFTRPYITTRNGKFFTGVAYTLPFRDYQFYKNFNSITCELYSLAQTIRSILDNCKSIYSSILNQEEIIRNMNKNFSNFQPDKHKKLFTLLSKMICSPDQRITYEEILSDPLFDNIKPLVEVHSITENKKYKNTIKQKDWDSAVYKFCFQLYSLFNFDIRSMFLTINNAKKCLHLCNNDNILQYIIVNAYIVSNLLHNPNYEYLDLLEEICDEFTDENEFISILIKVTQTLSGNYIYKTEWDTCTSEKELLIAFSKLLSLDTFILRKIIETVYPKKKQLNLHAMYDTFIDKLDINITPRSIEKYIQNEAFVLRKNSHIWIDNIMYPELTETNLKNLFINVNNTENMGYLLKWEEQFISNPELANYYIDKLLNLIDRESIHRYSYFLNIKKLQSLNKKQTYREENLYLLTRNTIRI